MASTYSTSLQIQLIGSGEQSGVWGTTTNTNWNLVEQAVAGVAQITMVNADYTLTVLNGVSDEARNAVLVVGGTNSAIRKIVAPLVTKTYTIFNNTSGGYAITIGGSTGTTVSIPNGITTTVYCDGTNFYSGISGTQSNFTATAFYGAGTGLTGTAAGLSIGGSAASSSSVANSLTFNNSGSGDAPGGTFNGSAAKTISYNSVGASPLAGSSSLVTVGTIVSGTWNGSTLAVAYGGTGVTTSTGTGSVVLSSSPTITSATLSSPTLVTAALGTPASGTLTNCTGLVLTSGVTGTLPVANGGTGVTSSTGTGSVVLSASPTFTGTPLAPTASAGTSTTQISTTAFVSTAITNLSLGTMSTQNANNVAITGGSITGVTISSLGSALPVASGGTGSTSLTANNVLLGNGTSAVQAVAPGTSGNVLKSNGTTWVSGAGFGWNVTYVNTSVADGDTYVLPSNCVGVYIWCTVSGSGNNGGVGRAQIKNSGGTVIGTMYINGTNIGGGADGGSGMTDGAGSFIPTSSAATSILLDVFNNARGGTFIVQAYVTSV